MTRRHALIPSLTLAALTLLACTNQLGDDADDLAHDGGAPDASTLEDGATAGTGADLGTPSGDGTVGTTAGGGVDVRGALTDTVARAVAATVVASASLVTTEAVVNAAAAQVAQRAAAVEGASNTTGDAAQNADEGAHDADAALADGPTRTLALPNSDPGAVDATAHTFAGIALAHDWGGIHARVGGLVQRVRHDGRGLRVLQQDEELLALQPARDAELDAGTRAWRGRPVRVITAAGRLCAGRLEALSHATDWFHRDELAHPRPVRADEVHDWLWSGNVVGDVRLDDARACQGEALLVQDLRRQPPRVARPLARVPQREAIERAFRALPEYAALREACSAQEECFKDPDTGAPPHWPLELRAFRFSGARRVHVTVSLPSGGCAEWRDGMAAVFTLSSPRDTAPATRDVYPGLDLGEPALLLDVERDGTLEMVTRRFPDGLTLLDDTGAQRLAWQPYFVGCGC